MSKRKTVELNLEPTKAFIKRSCRSNVVFSEMMGRHNQKTWVTEWGRGKNLPSPEEAAKMCEILSVEPEDILVRPEDIALVRSLMDEKKPTQEGEQLPEITMKLIERIKRMDMDQQSATLMLLNSLDKQEG